MATTMKTHAKTLLDKIDQAKGPEHLVSWTAEARICCVFLYLERLANRQSEIVNHG